MVHLILILVEFFLFFSYFTGFYLVSLWFGDCCLVLLGFTEFEQVSALVVVWTSEFDEVLPRCISFRF